MKVQRLGSDHGRGRGWGIPDSPTRELGGMGGAWLWVRGRFRASRGQPGVRSQVGCWSGRGNCCQLPGFRLAGVGRGEVVTGINACDTTSAVNGRIEPGQAVEMMVDGVKWPHWTVNANPGQNPTFSFLERERET